jgi:hypothetical protein
MTIGSEEPTSPEDVFVNCPFDDEYSDTFRALIFTIHACGFRPRSAREIDDGGEARIEKLYNLIKDCRYGIHDISRTELDKNNLPRFNMPLELGIFMGAKRFGSRLQKDKRLLIFDTEKYRYQKFISDIAGMDIHAHNADAECAITETRDWLANVSRRQLPGTRKLVQIYRNFRAILPTLADKLDLEVASITYVDYERLVVGWLIDSARTPP